MQRLANLLHLRVFWHLTCLCRLVHEVIWSWTLSISDATRRYSHSTMPQCIEEFIFQDVVGWFSRSIMIRRRNLGLLLQLLLEVIWGGRCPSKAILRCALLRESVFGEYPCLVGFMLTWARIIYSFLHRGVNDVINVNLVHRGPWYAKWVWFVFKALHTSHGRHLSVIIWNGWGRLPLLPSRCVIVKSAWVNAKTWSPWFSPSWYIVEIRIENWRSVADLLMGELDRLKSPLLWKEISDLSWWCIDLAVLCQVHFDLSIIY